MAPIKPPTTPRQRYLLRFASLFDGGRALAFECNEYGRVDLDALSDQARNNYFMARMSIGRDFAVPAVEPIAIEPSSV